MSREIQSAPGEQEFGGSKAFEMARRRYQRGSLRRRGSSWFGVWREDVRDATSGEVQRKQIVERLGSIEDFPTKKLAARELETRTQNINALTYRPRTVANFEQFSIRWQSGVMVNHKRSAQASERSIIKVHLLPRWGKMQLKEIEADPEAVQAWISSIRLEPKTQRNIGKLMSEMMDIAIEWGYITYNPLARVRYKPFPLKDEEFALSLEQIQAIITAAPEPYKTMYWILGETGIRAGEVLALGFEHFDLENRVIFIRRKVWRGELETVKSKKGVRSFAISEQLAEHVKLYADGRKSGFIFADGEGKPVTYDHAMYEEFQPLLEELKIPLCGFHAFRHGNASLMDQLNIPAKTRMDRLGHEKLDTTMGYTHAVSEDDRAVASQLGKMLTGSVQ